MLLMNLLKRLLKEFEYCKKVMRKHFNKNLTVSEKEEEQFQSSNSSWICEKLIVDEKLRDHCDITGKFRGTAHWSCNKFDVKIDVIPNRLEKCMAFFLNKNLVFIDSMQFMNSRLEKLVNNLLDNDFKYLTEKLGSKNVELLKQKDAYPYEYMDSLKRFGEEKLPDKKSFYSSVKDGTTGDNGKKLDGHVRDDDYLMCKIIWNNFNMKNMGDYHDHYLEKDVLLLADVFEKFIDTCLKFYGPDPCHYFSSHGLSRDAMLKVTGMRLKKIVNNDMYLFIEKGLRGGISHIAKG